MSLSISGWSPNAFRKTSALVTGATSRVPGMQSSNVGAGAPLIPANPTPGVLSGSGTAGAATTPIQGMSGTATGAAVQPANATPGVLSGSGVAGGNTVPVAGLTNTDLTAGAAAGTGVLGSTTGTLPGGGTGSTPIGSSVPLAPPSLHSHVTSPQAAGFIGTPGIGTNVGPSAMSTPLDAVPGKMADPISALLAKHGTVGSGWTTSAYRPAGGGAGVAPAPAAAHVVQGGTVTPGAPVNTAANLMTTPSTGFDSGLHSRQFLNPLTGNRQVSAASSVYSNPNVPAYLTDAVNSLNQTQLQKQMQLTSFQNQLINMYKDAGTQAASAPGFLAPGQSYSPWSTAATQMAQMGGALQTSALQPGAHLSIGGWVY